MSKRVDNAFAQLLRLYERRVFSLVLRMVRREAEALELTQEIFLQAFRSHHRFDASRPFRPWIYRIAVNICRNHQRAAARREGAHDVLDVADAMWSHQAETPERRAGVSEELRALEQHLAKLEDKDRALLLLRFGEEMSYAELRQIYSVPQSVLKMRVHRAVTRLRKIAGEVLQ